MFLFSVSLFCRQLRRAFESLLKHVTIFRWTKSGLNETTSKVLEVLVVPDKNYKDDMTLTLPQKCVEYFVY